MSNAKTQKNNHPSGTKKTKAFHGAGETIRHSLPAGGGPVMARRSKERKHKIVDLLNVVNMSRFTVYCSPFPLNDHYSPRFFGIGILDFI
jgi:hypothetical protein